MPKPLARFRADPEKVRVGIRRHEDLWYVRISARDGSRGTIENIGKHPNATLMVALRKAWHFKMPGVDFYMDWAYPHPFGSADNPTECMKWGQHFERLAQNGSCFYCRMPPAPLVATVH